jgi:hypothetical protein
MAGDDGDGEVATAAAVADDAGGGDGDDGDGDGASDASIVSAPAAGAEAETEEDISRVAKSAEVGHEEEEVEDEEECKGGTDTTEAAAAAASGGGGAMLVTAVAQSQALAQAKLAQAQALGQGPGAAPNPSRICAAIAELAETADMKGRAEGRVSNKGGMLIPPRGGGRAVGVRHSMPSLCRIGSPGRGKGMERGGSKDAMRIKRGGGVGSEQAQTLVALVDEGVTVDGGHTALMLACRAGHFLVARELLRAGATVDATDDAGLTALDHAQDCERTEVVAMLLEHASHALKKQARDVTP